MQRMKLLLPALALAASVAFIPAANAAPTVHMMGAGSSALFAPLAIAAVNDIDAAGTPHHFSIKGACATSTCAQLNDTRLSGIPIEPANLWVAYVCAAYPCTGANATDVWAYFQVDSTVGDRTFLARLADGTGAVQALLDTCMDTSVADAACESQNLVAGSVLFSFGVAAAQSGKGCTAAGNQCDDEFLPTDVLNALVAKAQKLNMAGTDIRPEDALYATERANQAFGTLDGLGYASSPTANFGASIQSGNGTGATATPVIFALPGNDDPITTGLVPPTITTFRVGESPIVFITNRTNPKGLGAPGAAPFQYTNMNDNGAAFPANSPAGNLYGGNENCDGASPALNGLGSLADFPLHVLIREPLSGTMNTVEFSSFHILGGAPAPSFPFPSGIRGNSVNDSPTEPTTTQEFDTGNPSVAGNNPLMQKPCNGGGGVVGDRTRGIGTGEIISGNGKGAGGILNTQDGIGYTFFGFSTVQPIANACCGYLTLDGVDPIFNKYAGGDTLQPGNGQLPTCTVGTNCTAKQIWTGGNSFPHLRDGTYRAWSALRILCDTNDTHCETDAKGVVAVVSKAQDDIHNNVGIPDFLPASLDGSFGDANGDGDLAFVRSHYAFKDSAFQNPNKYAKNHGEEQYVLLGVGGLPNNLANDANPETGGDAGGCIIPVGKAGTVCNLGKAKPGAVNGVVKLVLNGACTGPAPVAGDTVSTIGFNTLAYDGVFVVTGFNGTQITAQDSLITTSTPAETKAAFATLSVGCSQ
jgi:hypothetical protein